MNNYNVDYINLKELDIVRFQINFQNVCLPKPGSLLH